MTDVDSECWFAARTRRGQELTIKGSLDALDIRNFVPMNRTLKIRNGRKIKVLAPLIPNMVFLRTSKTVACSLANGYGLPIYYIIDRSTNRMLVVPDRQMDDFIRLVTEKPDSVELADYNPQPGERVRIVTGKLAGLEGEVLEADNGAYLVINVGTLFSARVVIQRNCLEPF